MRPQPAPEDPSLGSGRDGRAHLVGVNSQESTTRLVDLAVVPDDEAQARQQRLRRELFPTAGESEWSDWRWQLRHRVKSLGELMRWLTPSPAELEVLSRDGGFPFSVTPYYLSLVSPDDPTDPIRRCVVPCRDELSMSAGEVEDPLGEDDDMVVPGLVHRYPDRVLFLSTNECSTYCRYCTRARWVGRCKEHIGLRQRWEKCLEYIQEHTEVRDVLISGGDPLTLGDQALDYLLGRLRQIKHVELVRLGTKMPVVLPQRITLGLVRVLRRHHPLFMSLHFTHPAELTPEVRKACNKLADAGIPLGSQTVLLRGINDDVATLKKLFTQLLTIRVRPYYLYQCDPIPGSAHFRTSVERGLELLSGLRGHTSGYAVPTYVIDAPAGGGKIPVLPETCLGRDGDHLVLRNYEGRILDYPNPRAALGDVCN
jgi:lysine 2,3-aminomutase